MYINDKCVVGVSIGSTGVECVCFSWPDGVYRGRILETTKYSPVFKTTFIKYFGKCCKAVVIYGIKNMKMNVEKINDFKCMLNKLNIKYTVVHDDQIIYGYICKSFNPEPVIKDVIYIINCDKNEDCSYTKLTFGKNGYVNTKLFNKKICSANEMENVIKRKNVKKIIFVGDSRDSLVQYSEKIFLKKSNKIFYAVNEFNKCVEMFLFEIAKWILFPNINEKFHIISQLEYTVAIQYQSKKNWYTCMKITRGNILPIFVVKRFGKFSLDHFINKYDRDGKLVESSIIPSLFTAHGHDIVIDVDESKVVKVLCYGYNNSSVLNIKTYMDSHLLYKFPIISFFNNSSVCCFYGSSGYEYLDILNGVYGKDVFISFYEEEVQFYDKALLNLKNHPSFVVYDLLYIMLSDSEEISKRKDWAFEVEDDKKLIFDVNKKIHEYGRVKAPLDIIIACLIKFVLKSITTYSDYSEKKIGFQLHKVWTDKENDKFVYWIEKACARLNVFPLFLHL